MSNDSKTKRYIYRTEGVCPPEIHFQIGNGVLKEIRFVGGGCPGNAQLVSRLLRDLPPEEALKSLGGIDCRNNTSCPDQLARSITAALSGDLKPAHSFKVAATTEPCKKIGLIGDIAGQDHVLDELISAAREKNVDRVVCLGNLTGPTQDNPALLKRVRQEGLTAITGEMDYQYAQGAEPNGWPPLDSKDRDYLVRLPQVLSFQIGSRQAMAFFGQYIQSLEDFSDFEPFALEMNMVCELSGFLEDETVFPALEAMTPQFVAQVVIFSQPGRWGHWTVGGVDFIGVGRTAANGRPAWGLLEYRGNRIDFQIMNTNAPREE